MNDVRKAAAHFFGFELHRQQLQEPFSSISQKERHGEETVWQDAD